MRNVVNHIDKQDFLLAYSIARNETMTSANIQASFAATGVLLYDLDRVLEKLNTQIRTPSLVLPRLELEPWALETPHNAAEVKLQLATIRRALSSPSELALKQLAKGCELALNNAVLMAEQIRQLSNENARQVKKRAKKRRFLTTGGTLTMQEGVALQAPIVQAPIEPVEPVEPGIEAGGGVGADEPIVRPRAPRLCSVCRSGSHTARTCPERPRTN